MQGLHFAISPLQGQLLELPPSHNGACPPAALWQILSIPFFLSFSAVLKGCFLAQKRHGNSQAFLREECEDFLQVLFFQGTPLSLLC